VTSVNEVCAAIVPRLYRDGSRDGGTGNGHQHGGFRDLYRSVLRFRLFTYACPHAEELRQVQVQ
jgi:hypothetical protein